MSKLWSRLWFSVTQSCICRKYAKKCTTYATYFAKFHIFSRIYCLRQLTAYFKIILHAELASLTNTVTHSITQTMATLMQKHHTHCYKQRCRGSNTQARHCYKQWCRGSNTQARH